MTHSWVELESVGRRGEVKFGLENHGKRKKREKKEKKKRKEKTGKQIENYGNSPPQSKLKTQGKGWIGGKVK